MSNFIGTGREMLPSELPTLRDVLRYGLLLREQSGENVRNYPAATLAKDIYPTVLEKWELANSCFVVPILNSRVTVLKKIEENWEKAKNISLGRGKLEVKEAFIAILDKLFDILNCKCEIKLCSEFEGPCPGGADCKYEVHISCSCSKDMKIPVKELVFINSQRKKVGSVGQHQIGLPDLPEHRRQTKKQTRQEDELRRISEYKQKRKEELTLQPNEVISSDEDEEPTDVTGEEFEDPLNIPWDDSDVPSTSSTSQYNTLQLRNVALQSIRYCVGVRATAAITTAAFLDAGLITEGDRRLVVDHNKVRRAQEKVMKSLDEEFHARCQVGNIECIFFDGRQDSTKVLLQADNSSHQFPSIVKEEHYTVCSEPGGRYLCHFTPEKDLTKRKPAEVIANHLVDFLKKNSIDRSLQAIGGDSTNVNTGWEGGVMHWVEVKLNRKLIWLVCALHTNELPLRHLITELDGKTLSNNKWSGKIGNMLDSATELEINPSFVKISFPEPLVPLSDTVVKDLSTDQAYGYRITQAIRTGILPTDLALLEIGPVSHSRWLTTANRICRIWVSKHSLKGSNLKTLQLLVEYIVGVYYPCWFTIKSKFSWVEGPGHILYQLKLLKSQKKAVADIVLPTIQRSSWFAFSEMVLQTLLCSEDQEERKVGVQKIIELRNEDGDTPGDLSVRPRKTPAVNPNATSLLELIDWSENVYEPPLTCKLKISEIRKFVEEPMQVPKWPCHGQSIERCVKQVTEASGKVYSHEKREGFIRGQEASRRLMSRNESKQDLMNIVG
jgi:hypothetical protein